MKPRSTQSGTRENTASSRQHAPRFAMRSIQNQATKSAGTSCEELPPRPPSSAQTFSPNPPNNAAHIAATEGEGDHGKHLLTVHEVADLLQVPVSWVYGRTRKRSLERIPSYRLGKYWRFRQDEVLAWVESLRRGSHAA
jgi:excisionase family DNA binding protein